MSNCQPHLPRKLLLVGLLCGTAPALAAQTTSGADPQQVASTGPSLASASLNGRLEVTQGVQNPDNTVPLVAGRATWVRAYLTVRTSEPVSLRGRLQLRRPDGQTQLLVSDPVQLVPTGGAATMNRTDFGTSLNFPLPPQGPGSLDIKLVEVFQAATGTRVPCTTCDAQEETVEIGGPAVLRVKVIGFRYAAGDPPYLYSPRNIDFDRLASWLRRAYPVSNVEIEQIVMNALDPWPFECGDVNVRLARIRALDLRGGMDPRTHYYGLVSDAQGFMRGCANGIPQAPDPAAVASGPAGIPLANVPAFAWDTDGSYADWYGGHELAHTFGRRHIGSGCGETADDPGYPYAGGLIGNDAQANLGIDGAPPATVALLQYSKWHDIMTYCPSLWLSDYTYRSLLDRLREEDRLFNQGLLGAGPPPTGAAGADAAPEVSPGPAGAGAEAGPELSGANAQATAAPAPGDTLLNLIARISDIENNRGRISGIFPVAYRARPASSDSAGGAQRVEIRVLDGSRQLLGSYWPPVLMDQIDTLHADPTGRARTPGARGGMVNAFFPNRPEIAFVQLFRNGVRIDEVRTSAVAPQVAATSDLSGVAAGVGGTDLQFNWSIRDPDGGDVIYFVQISYDGGRRWSTIDETRRRSFTLPRGFLSGQSSVRLRVIATEGKNDAVVLTTNELATQP